MQKEIIAFVGSSGSGKTALMLALIDAMPEKVGICMSLTTRTPRNTAEDNAMYRFPTREEFERLIAERAFIHWVEHAGNYYGTLRADADAMLAARYAVGAFVEQGIMNLRRSGYHVRVVKIIPVGGFVPNVPSRKIEDAARDKIDVNPELIIENDFAPGGRERAMEELLAYVRGLS